MGGQKTGPVVCVLSLWAPRHLCRTFLASFLVCGLVFIFLPKGARVFFFSTKKRSTRNAQPFYCQPVWGGVAPGTWTL